MKDVKSASTKNLTNVTHDFLFGECVRVIVVTV